jgi:hypothetical protein
MLPEEKEACLQVLKVNPQKGDKLLLKYWDGETVEGNFFRYIYKGFVLKNKGEYIRVKCLDIEKVILATTTHKLL